MIYTFYSYKGGVGRSMALANVGELLYQLGLKVLMVDWDLEAPGLERYFPESMKEVVDRRGLMDLLLDYKMQLVQPVDESAPDELQLGSVEDYLANLHPADESRDPTSAPAGQLWLLSAGRRDGENFASYAQAVRTFDWQDFYDRWEGELYFEWLRQQFQQTADVVLIDSRTGVTEMGGVSTYHLADVVVMFCTGNDQNLDGTLRMADNFTRSQVTEIRQDRPLQVVVIPARLDQAQNDLLNDFFKRFFDDFKRFVPTDPGSIQKYGIPYVPLYSYKEVVAIREKDQRRVPDMIEAYAELVKLMAHLEPSDSRFSQFLPLLSYVLSSGQPLTRAERSSGTLLTITDGRISDQQRLQLQQALVSAFQTNEQSGQDMYATPEFSKDEVEQLATSVLGAEEKPEDTPANPLDFTRIIINRAEELGKLEDLVIAAIEARPDHEYLRGVAQQLGRRARAAAQRAAEANIVPLPAIDSLPGKLRPKSGNLERLRRQMGHQTGMAGIIFGKTQA